MKQATVFAVLITIVSFSFARPSNDQNRYIVKNHGDTSLVKTPGIQNMLEEILRVTGLQSNFELKEGNVPNIEASVSHRKRYILYNPAFITTLNNVSKNKWSVMALLAHEVGHHLNGHTIRKGGSTPELELEADEFAGFILYKLGATLDQSQNVMNYIAKEKTSRTHPARKSRLSAIEKGWNRSFALEQMDDTARQ